jgi:hypothetical protein
VTLKGTGIASLEVVAVRTIQSGEKAAAKKLAGATAAAASAKAWKAGDKGPGGGAVFASGGGFLEASPVTTLDPAALNYAGIEYYVTNAVKEYRGGGLSDWKIPTVEELRLVYALQQSGAANFDDGWIASGTGETYNNKPVMLQVSRADGFPGYRIVLAGGGPNTYKCIHFGTGTEGWWFGEGFEGGTSELNLGKTIGVVAVRAVK